MSPSQRGCIGCLVDTQPHTCGFEPAYPGPSRWKPVMFPSTEVTTDRARGEKVSA